MHIPPPPEFTNFSQARAHFKELLDAAERDQVAKVYRDGELCVVLSGERLRQTLAQANPSRSQSEPQPNGGWAVFLAEPPLAVEGATFDDAVDEMVGELREYAEDWDDHLGTAPNHREYWGTVQLIKLSTDEELRGWLRGPSK